MVTLASPAPLPSAKDSLAAALAAKEGLDAAAKTFVDSIASDLNGAVVPGSGVVELLDTTLAGSDKKKAYERQAALHVVKDIVARGGAAVMPVTSLPPSTPSPCAPPPFPSLSTGSTPRLSGSLRPPQST